MSINEWGQLRKVVVGIADYAKIPAMDKSLRVVNYADSVTAPHKEGLYPAKVIEEANEDLWNIENFLRMLDIEVVRPEIKNTGYYQYCPRDSIFVYDDLQLATPMPIRSRHDDIKGITKHFDNLQSVKTNFPDNFYNEDCIGNKDILALKETFPAFDAANIIKANDKVLYLVSNSGNYRGAELLQAYLGDRAKVCLLEDVYSYMHIDSTIAFLREGLMLVNPERIKDRSQLPAEFRSWDIIQAPEPTDIGHYTGYCNSSPWINVNLLSVNQNLVLMEENQHETRKVLERHGIDCAMLPMRHARTLGGTFHCVTLDLERDVE